MGVNGPTIIYFETEAQWRAFLKEKNVTAWYAKIHPSFRPGAFIRTDGDGKPDEQDRIFVAPGEWAAAKRGEKWALDLMYHEWLHAKVPYGAGIEAMGLSHKEWEALKERFSHPMGEGIVASLKHALRIGFKTNAFSRVFRWQRLMGVPYREFRAWWPVAAAEAEKYVS